MMSLGVAYFTVLLHAACLLCIYFASSVNAECLALNVSGFTDFFCSSAAATKPLPYRSKTWCLLS